ncbi:ABC transporter permease [Lysinibacillus sp. KU-BSD001]|uniref:ABC transporter permease n=1 Tax=Lysinibacillus sp. KU-BSD001 TaxID=3141328 RepID=UPI0036E1AD50
MFQVIFKSMLVTAVRDKITVFYSLAFPLLLMIGLGYYFDQGQQQLQIVAGITAISTIFWGMQGIAFQVHAQRNRGVYKLVKLTPMPLILFIFIMVLARTSVGVLINFIVWLTGILLFDINVTGSTLLLTFLLIVIGTLCFTSIGFVISNFARNEAQISMVSNFIQLPMIFMSEAFYSLDRAPAWVVFIGKMLPFEHYVKALRGLLLVEEGILLIGFGILFVYLLFALFLSILTFKWESSEEKPRSWKKRTS